MPSSKKRERSATDEDKDQRNFELAQRHEMPRNAYYRTEHGATAAQFHFPAFNQLVRTGDLLRSHDPDDVLAVGASTARVQKLSQQEYALRFAAPARFFG